MVLSRNDEDAVLSGLDVHFLGFGWFLEKSLSFISVLQPFAHLLDLTQYDGEG